MAQPQVLHRALVCTAGRNLDLAAGRIGDRGGPAGASAINEVLTHALVTGAEVRAARQFDAGREASRGDVGAAGGNFLDRRFARVHRIQP